MTVTLALPDGTTHQALTPRTTRRLQRKLCRAERGSNADLNAACNIAAGHAVTAREGSPWGGPVNREPQHAPSQVA